MFRPSLPEMDHPAPSTDRLSRRMRREVGQYRPAVWDSPTATPDGCTADAGLVAPPYVEMPEPGIVCWLSYRDVERSRLRSALAIGALLVLAGLWLTPFTSDESDREQAAEHRAGRSGDDTVSGVVILELFTLVPLGFAISRRRRLGRLRDHMSSIGAAEQEESIAELATADEVVWC